MTFNPLQPFDLPLLTTECGWLHESNYVGILKRARVELAELKGYCQALPNPMLLLSPAIVKESLASSEIENIHTTVENVLRNQLLSEKQRGAPEKEVLHYREAILWGFDNLTKYSLSSRLVIGIASKLTSGRYSSYRTTQNALTRGGTGEVIYTPPQSFRFAELLSNWENFVNNHGDGLDPLIKAAVAHYQFEAIHPLNDGNGRTGRILMVLQLIETQVLQLPVIYISGYINNNKSEYYRLLSGVSEKADWEPYIRFVLTGLEQQARITKQILLDIMDLFRQTKAQLKSHYKDIYSSELVETIFYSPIVTPYSLAQRLDVHRNTAARYLNRLKQSGFLQDIELGRNHFYAYRPLLNILQGN